MTTEKLIKILLIKTTTFFALFIKICIVWSFVPVFVILFRSLLFALLSYFIIIFYNNKKLTESFMVSIQVNLKYILKQLNMLSMISKVYDKVLHFQ